MKKQIILIFFISLYATNNLIINQQTSKRSLQNSIVNNNISATYESLLNLNQYNTNPEIIQTIIQSLYTTYKPHTKTAYYLQNILNNDSFIQENYTVYVDPTLLLKYNIPDHIIVSQNRIIFDTISAALSYIGTNNANTIWTIYIKQGCYNEDLTIPAGYSITLKGEQLVVLGSGRNDSSEKNSITWNIQTTSKETTLNIENLWIRNSLTLTYTSTATKNHYLNLKNVRIEGTLSQNQYVENLYLTLNQCELNSEFNTPTATLSTIENSDLGGSSASICKHYNYIKTSNISHGLTFQEAANNTTSGFFDCNLAGTFTGNSGSIFRLNTTSNYYFNENGATLINATKSLVTE
jgi:hypothetical protein